MKTISEIKTIHRNGELEVAKEDYLVYLQEHPTSAEAHDALGILYTQQGDYPKAIDSLSKALTLDNSVPQYYLHLANVYKMQNLTKEAISILQNLTQKHSDYAPGFNNLGILYYSQKNYKDAIESYCKAIQLVPDYIDALYNLSLAYQKNSHLNYAVVTINKLLSLAPEHLAGKFQHALLLMEEKKYTEAIHEFKNILKQQPNHFESNYNLATCYVNLDDQKNARHFYLQALALDPEDVQTFFNLAVVSHILGETDKAIQYYQSALILKPNYYEAHHNLAILFQEKNQYAFALKHWQECLKLKPNNKAILYSINAIQQQKTALTPPHEYISTLFDAYADHYDEHLLHALDYNVPELLVGILKHHISDFTHKKWSILDLGCGTGLASMPLKKYADKITGVDLSGKMLAEARKKNIYDELLEQNILSFLQQENTSYNLVIAADTFVYFGDLDELFKLISRNLAPNGYLIFNTEISQTLEENFFIKQSGRFGHTKEYLVNLAEQNNFSIIHYETAATRMQNNEPVLGHLLLLQKGN